MNFFACGHPNYYASLQHFHHLEVGPQLHAAFEWYDEQWDDIANFGAWHFGPLCIESAQQLTTDLVDRAVEIEAHADRYAFQRARRERVQRDWV